MVRRVRGVRVEGGARMKWLAMIPACSCAWFACMCAVLPAEGNLSPAQIALVIVSLFAVLTVNMVLSGLASRSGNDKTQKGE